MCVCVCVCVSLPLFVPLQDWGNETDAWWSDFLRINSLLQPLRPLLKGDFYPLTEWSIDESGSFPLLLSRSLPAPHPLVSLCV